MSTTPPAPPASAPPPALPGTFVLDSFTLPRARLHRVYWNTQVPLTCATDASNRYDCPAIVPKLNRFGVLYLAYELETCWLETVVRNALVRPAGDPIRIPAAKMTNRWACEVHVAGTLNIAKFADESLVDLGESASNIMGESYLRTQTWSNLLHAHANPEVDGLQYRSRFKSGEFCIALFDRAIAKGKLTLANERSIDPATSREMQSTIKRFNVIPY